MLPSTGYFKSFPCPFFKSGYCERPHCHFRHVVEPETPLPKETHSSCEPAVSATGAAAASAAAAAAAAPAGLDSSLLQEMVCRAVREALQSGGSATSSAAAAVSPDTEDPPPPPVDAPTTAPVVKGGHRIYPVPKTVSYRPTPLRDLERRRSVLGAEPRFSDDDEEDEGSQKPAGPAGKARPDYSTAAGSAPGADTRCAEEKGSSSGKDENGPRSNSREKEEREAEQADKEAAEFDLLEQILAESSKPVQMSTIQKKRLLARPVLFKARSRPDEAYEPAAVGDGLKDAELPEYCPTQKTGASADSAPSLSIDDRPLKDAGRTSQPVGDNGEPKPDSARASMSLGVNDGNQRESCANSEGSAVSVSSESQPVPSERVSPVKASSDAIKVVNQPVVTVKAEPGVTQDAGSGDEPRASAARTGMGEEALSKGPAETGDVPAAPVTDVNTLSYSGTNGSAGVVVKQEPVDKAPAGGASVADDAANKGEERPGCKRALSEDKRSSKRPASGEPSSSRRRDEERHKSRHKHSHREETGSSKSKQRDKRSSSSAHKSRSHHDRDRGSRHKHREKSPVSHKRSDTSDRKKDGHQSTSQTQDDSKNKHKDTLSSKDGGDALLHAEEETSSEVDSNNTELSVRTHGDKSEIPGLRRNSETLNGEIQAIKIEGGCRSDRLEPGDSSSSQPRDKPASSRGDQSSSAASKERGKHSSRSSRDHHGSDPSSKERHRSKSSKERKKSRSSSKERNGSSKERNESRSLSKEKERSATKSSKDQHASKRSSKDRHHSSSNHKPRESSSVRIKKEPGTSACNGEASMGKRDSKCAGSKEEAIVISDSDDESPRRSASPLPDLSALEELPDMWEDAPPSGGEEDVSSEDEADTLAECERMFNEYQPPSDGEQLSAALNKAREMQEKASKEAEKAVVEVGKKRIAHVGGLDSVVRTVSRAAQKTTPAQAMHARWQKLVEMQQQRISQLEEEQRRREEADLNRRPTPALPVPPVHKKRRVAHVANVSALLAKPPPPPDPPHSGAGATGGAGAAVLTTPAQTHKSGGKRTAHTPTTTSVSRPKIPAEFGGKVPCAVRQKYLDHFCTDLLKLYPGNEALAYKQALEEEQAVYARSSSRRVYSNLAVAVVKRLRDASAAGAASSHRGVGPVPNRMVSHLNVLAGKGGATGSWSIERNKKVEDIKIDELYQRLEPYLMTEDQLAENGFPRSDPRGRPGHAFLMKVDERQRITPRGAPYRTCIRCSRTYGVSPQTGLQLVPDTCVYHWGRVFSRRGQKQHTCCSMEAPAEGCCVADCHVSDNFDPEHLDGYMQTLDKPDPEDGNHGVFALDCEMCYTSNGNELCRVTIINAEGGTAFESMVKPTAPIIDYNTRFSGIKDSDMEGVTTTLRDVQAVLLSMFSSKTILIGHSLESDFKALKLIHSTVVDTSVVFPHKIGPPHKRALRNLCSDYLKRIIQNDVGGHDSAEDAISCMDLMLWRLKEDAKMRN